LNVFSIVPKQTTTEFAIYRNGVQVAFEVLEHSISDLHALFTPPEQGLFRFDAIMRDLEKSSAKLDDIDIVISQANFSELPAGIYLVNHKLLDFLKDNKLEENPLRSGVYVVSRLADHINERSDVECVPLVVQPAIDNEIIPEAVLSGIGEVKRRPVFHAFSQRAATSLYTSSKGKEMKDVRVIVAHLGAEISVGAHDHARIIDSNSPLDGEGPFSPTTSGSLPVDSLVDLCYTGKYDMDEMMAFVNKEGGLTAHLRISKLADVQEACRGGDQRVRFMVRAMAYRVAREIGARAAALRGDLEAIILTGPWALFEEFTDAIRPYVDWIAPVEVHVWESELYMLAVAAMETFKGNNEILLYGRDEQSGRAPA
jgi:butyrate kinase